MISVPPLLAPPDPRRHVPDVAIALAVHHIATRRPAIDTNVRRPVQHRDISDTALAEAAGHDAEALRLTQLAELFAPKKGTAT